MALLASHLALHDIYPGEPNPRLERSVLQVSFTVIAISQLSALATLGRVLRGTNEPGGEAV